MPVPAQQLRPQGVAFGSEQRIHATAAADVAATGADLLFGTAPSWSIAEAHGEQADATAEGCEARLLELATEDGWQSLLLEAAEIAGALSGVYLKPVADPSVVPYRPLLDIVHPDVAVPCFRHGRLVEVVYWSEWQANAKGKVWRHLERHSPGLIEHALYLGGRDTIGQRQHLALSDQTLELVTDDADPYGGGSVDLTQYGIDGLLSRYVPNALPNRRHRKDPVGRSDTQGCEGLMRALDTAWTSWLRDIRLAKARLLVPDEFIEKLGGRGTASYFDPDREIFTPLDIDGAAREKAGIELVQPAIRWEAHEKTCLALFTQIVQTAGYSPQSFGLPGDGGPAKTATEIDAREHRSESTTERKQAVELEDRPSNEPATSSPPRTTRPARDVIRFSTGTGSSSLKTHRPAPPSRTTPTSASSSTARPAPAEPRTVTPGVRI
jgi:hypothetical protein